MTISSEITNLENTKAAIKQAIIAKGVSVGENDGFASYATKIGQISSGTSPVISSLNITPTTSAQTITAPSGTDGYSPINVSAVTNSIDSNIVAENIKNGVSILGVSGTYTGSGESSTVGPTREVTAQGIYQVPSSNFSFTLPSNIIGIGKNALYSVFKDCQYLTSVNLNYLTQTSGENAMYGAFDGCSNLTNVDLSGLTTLNSRRGMMYAFNNCSKLVNVNLRNLTSINSEEALSSAFNNCSKLTTLDLGSVTLINGLNVFNRAFSSCTNLETILFTNLETIGTNSSSSNYYQFNSAFSGCSKLTSITFPKLTAVYCTGSSTNGTFASNNKIQKLYFPKLNTITYGAGASSTNQNACKNIFYGCSSLTELHFGAANQAAIEASPGYSTAWGRGAGNVTIYFDL